MEGSAEFGDRALVHRSIVGDPRNPTIKDRINSEIKYPEAYRPFTSAVLAERVTDMFDIAPTFTCPYMEKVFHIRDSCQTRLPAGVSRGCFGPCPDRRSAYQSTSL